MERQRWAQRLVAVLMLVALCACSRRVLACGACLCDTEPRSIVNLIRDVPLNLDIPLRVFEPGEPAPQLERVSDGTPVPTTVKLDSEAAVWWLKVDEDLQPSTEYRIARGAAVEMQFTTGTLRDEQLPTMTGVSTTPGGNGGFCDVQTGGQLTWLAAGDDSPFVVSLDIEIVVAGTAQRIYTDYQAGVIALGHSQMGCFGATELTGVSPNNGYPGRVRLRDAGGHVSDWYTFVLIVAAEEPGGCGIPSQVAGSAGMSPTLPEPSEGGVGGDAPNGAGAASPDGLSPRTSKGCGCALAAEGAPSGTAALALASLFFVRRRRVARR